jgi:tetratricopeptide (TPR) repeat protein
MALATVFAVRPELAEGFIAGKYFRFYGAMGLIAITALFHSGFKTQDCSGTWRFKICREDVLLLLYGVLTLSVSLWVNHSEAATKHVLLLLILLLYFYFKRLLRVSETGRYWLLLFFLFTGAAEACWGLRQLYGYTHSQHHLFRLTGSFFNPGPYACWLATITPCALHYLLRDRACLKVKFRLHYWPVYLRWGMAALTCLGVLLVLPAAMSRTAWLAVLGGCAVIVRSRFGNSAIRRFGNFGYLKHLPKFVSSVRFPKLYARYILWFVLPAVFALGCIGMYYLKKDSADGRALIWKISLQTAWHHPTGVGIGNFSGSYGDEQAAYFASGKASEQEQYVAGNPEYGFNEYLQMAVEQGILPFLLFVYLTGYSVYAGFRRKRIASTASLTALLIAATASYPFSVLPFPVALAFLLADIHHSKIGNRQVKGILTDKKKRRRFILSAYGMPVAGLCVVAACLYNRYPTFQAYREWAQARPLYHANAGEAAARAYAPLYPLLSDRVNFLFEYGRSLSQAGRYAESNAVLEKAMRTSCDPMLYNVAGKNFQAQKRYAEAEACFHKATHIVPGRLYPWYLLAKLYEETGLHDKACETARLVLTKEPKVQSTAVREMREEMRKLIQQNQSNKVSDEK